ncbi:Crp/Fnr family transcriptional regulator [Helicobacter pametensis]|uniref:Crp/Fnr family transcriptional regulator n=1 Tax=Helicobacter pametensis TaxID=95149 RepID=UPI0004B50DF4|nr:Crp/Fnr family transcriptional regulator [Helicobacter pametensis]
MDKIKYQETKEEILKQWIDEFGLHSYQYAIKIQKFPKGKRLFSSLCEGVICVLEGSLRALSVAESGKELTLFALGVGEVCVLSSACMIKGMDLDVSLEAVQTSDVAILPSKIAAQITDNTFHNQISLIINQRLMQVLKTLNQTAFVPLSERVREFLNLPQQEIRITHEEIANHFGSTREAISRILKEMEKNGEISLHRGKIIRHI